MRTRTSPFFWPLAAAALLASMACAEEIGSDNDANTEGGHSNAAASNAATDLLTHTDNGDGTFTTRVEATSEESWLHINLEDRSLVTVTDPATSSAWDLGFQRFKIKTNSGISGQGGVGTVALPGEDFDALTQAPASGYVEDAADGDDEDSDDDLAFLGAEPWYDYNPADHTLSPRDAVYVVRTVEGNYFKIQMLGYYSDAGSAGYPQFRWGAIDPPEGGDTLPEGVIEVDASASDAWVYVTIGGRVIDTDQPETDLDWDLAVSRTQLRTNGGTSGAGLGGALEAEGSFDAITTAPTVGYAVDAMLPLPGPPGSGEFSGSPVLNTWYDYDSATHAVSPRDAAFILRTADGRYARLRIDSYEDGVYRMTLKSLSDVVAGTHQAMISPGEEGSWTYLDLTTGEIGDGEASWDVAVQRTMMQTNSGTSGDGLGGALEAEAAALAEVTAAPSGAGCYLPTQGHVCDCEVATDACGAMEGVWTDQCACEVEYTVDEMLPLPGPPGSGEFSGSPVLNTWYDYDSATHVVSPRDTVFVVRTADGEGYARVKMVEYSDGTLHIELSYSGAGRTQF